NLSTEVISGKEVSEGFRNFIESFGNRYFGFDFTFLNPLGKLLARFFSFIFELSDEKSLHQGLRFNQLLLDAGTVIFFTVVRRNRSADRNSCKTVQVFKHFV